MDAYFLHEFILEYKINIELKIDIIAKKIYNTFTLDEMLIFPELNEIEKVYPKVREMQEKELSLELAKLIMKKIIEGKINSSSNYSIESESDDYSFESDFRFDYT